MMPTSLNGNTLLFREPNETTNVSLVGSLNNLTLGGPGGDAVLSGVADPTGDSDAINKGWSDKTYYNSFLTKLLNRDPVKLVFVGSSATEGFIENDPVTGDPVYADPTYPQRVGQLLEMFYNRARQADFPTVGSNITIVNSGQGGATAQTIIDTFNAKVTVHNPDVVIQMVGVNDVNTDVEPEVFQNNLQILADMYKKGGYNVYYCTTNPVRTQTFGANLNIQFKLGLFNQIIKTVALTNNFPIIDLFQQIQEIGYNSRYFSMFNVIGNDADVHPTQEGYDIMASIVFSNIIPTAKVSGDTILPVVCAPYQYSRTVNADTGVITSAPLLYIDDDTLNPYKYSYIIQRVSSGINNRYCVIAVFNMNKGCDAHTFDVKYNQGGENPSRFQFWHNGVVAPLMVDTTCPPIPPATLLPPAEPPATFPRALGYQYGRLVSGMDMGINIFEFAGDSPTTGTNYAAGQTGSSFGRLTITALIFKPPVVYYNNDFLVVSGTDTTLGTPGSIALNWATPTEINGITFANPDFTLNPNKLYIVNLVITLGEPPSTTFGLYQTDGVTPISQIYTITGSTTNGDFLESSTASVSIFYSTVGPPGSPQKPLSFRVVATSGNFISSIGNRSSVTIYNIN